MRRVVGTLAALVVAASGLITAAPAQAVATVTTVCGAGPLYTFMTPSLSVTAGDTIPIQGAGPAFSMAMTLNGATGPASISGTSTENYVAVAASGWIDATISGGPCNGQTARLTFTAAGGSTGGDSTSAPAPVLETLTLQVSTGSTSCTGGSPTGYSGSWLQLPAADECSQSGPNANPNAKLLGWATDPIFPVAVAQQIVNLNYGPIDDYFYGMRMIFIPAGGWTYVSGSNNLYPIWSN